MRRVPKDISGAISFYSNHLSVWTDHSTEIGSTPEQVADFGVKLAAATDAYQAQLAAQASAQAATATLHNALEALAISGGAILQQIGTKARTGGVPIYALANVDPPAAPSPRPAPGKVIQLKTQLQGDGSLVLVWKCQRDGGRSGGTMYQIYRADGLQSPFQFLGVTGKKKFIDTTIPPGGGGVREFLYKIIPIRSTKTGPPAEFPIPFGGGISPAAFQSVSKAAA